MAPKAEYWTLTSQQFNEIKSGINELGENLLNKLQQYGFTKIKSNNDWLGLTIEKKENDLLTFVSFSLEKETPQQFELLLRKWNVNNPPQTCSDLYRKYFARITDIETSIDTEVKMIAEKLE